MAQYDVGQDVEQTPVKKPVSAVVAIIVWLFFWPVGLILIWKTAMSRIVKLFLTILTLALFAFVLYAYNPFGQQEVQSPPMDSSSVAVQDESAAETDSDDGISIQGSITVNGETIELG